MDDAVAFVGQVEMHDAEILRMPRQFFHGNPHDVFGDFLNPRDRRRHAVIGHGEVLLRFPNRAPLFDQRVEGTVLPVRQQLAVHIQQRLAVVARDDDVIVPNLLEEGLPGHSFLLHAGRV